MDNRDFARAAPWAVAVGAAAGATAVAWSVLRVLRARRLHPYGRAGTELDQLEEAAVEALRRDQVTGACAIDVAAIGPGIVELSGVVPNGSAGQRAARVLHALPGVRTVINRLEEGSVEERLAQNRARLSRGEASLRSGQWEGVRVGMGRRRQSYGADPAPADDTVERLTREFDVNLADVPEVRSPVDAAGEGERPNRGI
ncbi:MAG: BON domain-containing protein [Gemmatimonadota bacterium]